MSRWRHNGIPGIINNRSISTIRVQSQSREMSSRREKYLKVISSNRSQIQYLRWTEPEYPESNNAYLFRNKELLTTHDEIRARRTLRDLWYIVYVRRTNITVATLNSDSEEFWELEGHVRSDIPIPAMLKT